MKRNLMLTITSLLSIILLTFHLADDILLNGPRGLGNFIGILILLIYLIGTLLLAERRSGYVVMILGGIVAVGMPVIHMMGNGIGKARGLFFIFGLLALGVLGLFNVLLAAQGLWSSKRSE